MDHVTLASEKKTDESGVTLSLHQRRVYHLLTLIPKGMVTTYGELARALGGKGARAVGNTLNRNPFAPRIPCHRVVRSDGSIGGYAGGLSKKIELLREESVLVQDGKISDFPNNTYIFTSADRASVADLRE